MCILLVSGMICLKLTVWMMQGGNDGYERFEEDRGSLSLEVFSVTYLNRGRGVG